ncbi:MAG: YggU family protein [Anaerolineae bacterium]|nr:YggU family protein [Anaerolineae bacterium]
MDNPVFATITIRLQPASNKDEITGWMGDGTLKIKVKAKPVEGQANASLINLLSKRLHIPKSRIEIVMGEKSKQKTIRVQGFSLKDFKQKIDEILAQEP